jgi:outer membrane protein OmpA-like peptidoglycan-associated protein
MNKKCFGLIVPLTLTFLLILTADSQVYGKYKTTVPRGGRVKSSRKMMLPTIALPMTAENSQPAGKAQTLVEETLVGPKVAGAITASDQSKTYLVQAPSGEEDIVTAEELIKFYTPKKIKTRGVGGIITGKTIVRKQFRNILFDFNSYNIRQNSYRQIDEIGKALRIVIGSCTSCIFTIEGHTDNIGKEKYNNWLSQKRADAVKNYLIVRYKIDVSRIESIGFGEKRPVATNETTFGRSQNRRVEIVRK